MAVLQGEQAQRQMGLDIHSQLQAGFIDIELGAVQRGSDALLSAGASQMPEDAGGFFQEKGKIFTAQTGKFLGMEMLRPHKGGGGLYQKISGVFMRAA